MPAKRDHTLDSLLDMDGLTLVLEDGWWVKCRVWLIKPDAARPHGIRYELTLHDRSNRRVFGYDNAHAVERPGGRFVEQPREYDHVHRGPKDHGQPYAFESAGRLVEDFWKGVYAIIGENS